MNLHKKSSHLLIGAIFLFPTASAFSDIAPRYDEINNTLNFTSGFFIDEPLIGEERPQISKFSLDTEVFIDVSDQFSLTARTYFQYEHLSDENTHADLREFLFRYSGEQWELNAGIDQIFWGVVESRNLVDTINQNDFSADFTGGAKLGQPLLSFTRYMDKGDLSFYYLPAFREPEYASSDSRPRLPFAINQSLTTYESPDREKEASYALRWSGNSGIWDLGLHAFRGTRREPLITFTDEGFASRFVTISQAGLDAQATVGSLLAKLEWIQQNGREIENHSELVAGFEYTIAQAFGGDIDVGLLSEYLYDSRDEQADHLFQNDLMTGVRVALNDANSTELLLTLISDLENQGKTIQFDFDRRIGPNFTVNLGGQWWRDTENDASLSTFSAENNVRFRLNWYF